MNRSRPRYGGNGWHRTDPNTPAAQERRRVYNSREHRALRKKYQRVIDSGEGACWRCGGIIYPGEKWHLGHDDHDRSVYRGAEHASCNVRAAARAGNARSRTATQARQWTRTW